MRLIRIIPRLDIKGPNLVKGIHLEGLRVLGKPEDFAYRYYLDGADELIYMDVGASLYGRNNLLEVVRRTAKQIFIPLTVGGGIRSVDDIKDVLRAGADKVAINTAAIKDPGLIKEGAKIFGSQCIVVSIEARKIGNGVYEALTDNGRQSTGVDVFKWARMVSDLGAGEILITSVEQEGSGKGYDIELISKISDSVSIPVIAHGGAGKIGDIEELVNKTCASAVSAASIFHYHKITKDAVSGKFDEGNIDFLKKYSEAGDYQFKRIHPVSVLELKEQLKETDIVHIASNGFSQPYNPGIFSAHDHFIASSRHSPVVTVLDYNCGNLFSIEHALREIGANFEISNSPDRVRRSDMIILPGVGAFQEGMKHLEGEGLIEPILTHVRNNKPILGICLGMQLLMSESEEFGSSRGLNLIKGKTVKLSVSQGDLRTFKIPHVGWNRIMPPRGKIKNFTQAKEYIWKNTLLDGIPPESAMYFVHSYIVVPEYRHCIIAETEYANNVFCSVVQDNNVFGCQFHPERSGELGLNIYRQFVFGMSGHKVKMESLR